MPAKFANAELSDLCRVPLKIYGNPTIANGDGSFYPTVIASASKEILCRAQEIFLQAEIPTGGNHYRRERRDKSMKARNFAPEIPDRLGRKLLNVGRAISVEER